MLLTDLPWWAYVVFALLLTHVTIIAVTVYLHRCQAHRSLELNGLVAHFFRFWLWLTTGMVTREWVAVHRKHHATCDTHEDPHSPQFFGLNKVLFKGVWLYRKATENAEEIERYGKKTPADWIEHHLYSRYSYHGLLLMLAIDIFVFGALAGFLIWLVQVIWIPFWAAGVVNGVGHFGGYRNFNTKDASRNIVPWGIIIGGEELHNNHHAFPGSARLSYYRYEIDLGWIYIRWLSFLRLARVLKVSPSPRLGPPREQIDAITLKAIQQYHHDIESRYVLILRKIYQQAMVKMKDKAVFFGLKRWIGYHAMDLPQEWRQKLDQFLVQCPSLETAYVMRDELFSLFPASLKMGAHLEQAIAQLQSWCQRAENSGIDQLVKISYRLKRYSVSS